MKITLEISPDKIANLFVSAFEGNYSPWLHFAESGDAKPARGHLWYSDADVYTKPFAFRLQYDTEDGEEGDGKGRKTIGQADVARGLEAMAQHCPQRLGEILQGDTDAITADCFLQCIVFGHLVYG